VRQSKDLDAFNAFCAQVTQHTDLYNVGTIQRKVRIQK